MVKLAEELGVDQMSFHNLIPQDAEDLRRDQCLYEDDEDVLDVIQATSPPRKELEVVMPRLYKRGEGRRKCSVVFSSLYCNPQGDISPCCQIVPQAQYGNILEDREAWNSPMVQKMRATFLDDSLPLPETCRTCASLSSEWRPPYVPAKRGMR